MLCNQSMRIIVVNVFCMGRHANVSAVYFNQSMFHPNAFHRTISLNSTHFLILRLRDINQIRFSGKTFIPKEKIANFVSVYKTHVENVRFRPILIDFTQTSDSTYLIRVNIAGPSFEQVILIYKSMYRTYCVSYEKLV